LSKGAYVVSSDSCDYEVRKSLLLESVKKNSFNSLDNLDTEVMLESSQIWVETRKIGQQTADNYNIDVDIIILAHWQLLKKQDPSRYLVIATTGT
jgi:tRNA uridine 5-carbamoylmethylation protein Kti12